jgi:hypothetical protein
VNDDPALVLGNRLRFLDEHDVANLVGLFSSCALYFFEIRTVFFMTGCVKRRSTLTTTVFSFLSLTTVPCNTRFGMVFVLKPWPTWPEPAAFSAAIVLMRAMSRRTCFTRRSLFELAGGLLEAQVELLLLEAGQSSCLVGQSWP